MRSITNNRFWVLIALLVCVVLLAVRCVPDKELDITQKAVPVDWISQDIVMFQRADQSFLFNANSGRETAVHNSDTPAPQVVWKHALPDVGIEPAFDVEFIREDYKRYLIVDGEKILVERRHASRAQGINQGFPKQPYLPFHTYRHSGKTGLLTFENAAPQMTDLPLLYPENQSPPAVLWDAYGGRFFAFQLGCARTPKPRVCARTAWWLSQDLKVIETFALPEQDLLDFGERLSCFSCGCGCYSREDAYAVNGKIYFHLLGFPVPHSLRGVYSVDKAADGTRVWTKQVRGRVEPPLLFSPSGCKVAFFRVSRFGDGPEVSEICALSDDNT